MIVLRQGDILLVATATLAETAVPALPVRRDDRLCHTVAMGEATGHAHTLLADDRVAFYTTTEPDPGQTLGYLAITGPGAVLEHQEHRAMPVPPGLYRVVQQREYEPTSRLWARAGD